MIKKFEQYDNRPRNNPELTRKVRGIVKVVTVAIATLGIGGIAAEIKGGYTSKTAEVVWLSSDLEKLLELEKYLKENGDRIVTKLRRADSENLWPTVKLLKEVKEKVEIANESLSEIRESDVRLNSKLIKKAVGKINKIIRVLNGSRIEGLHDHAKRFRDSKKGFGIVDWIGSTMTDTNAVIACSSHARALEKDMRKLKKILNSITEKMEEGMSNNKVLNYYLEIRRGKRGLK
jgi:hypothetical protein